MVLQFDMTQSPSSDYGSSHHAGHGHAKKKRVGKACDSCRIKKTKCDGKKPCSRCILDNKICVFTEKRKQREKSHPSGYVELLETRLDILTKSLEKLVELSTPHLAFLQQLVAEHEAKKIQNGQNGHSKGVAVKHESDSNDELSDYHSDDEDDRSDENDLSSDSAVPINKVVEYLINKESLLSTLPVEWERGALIAANFNARDLESSAKLFAEHRTNINDNDDAKPGSGSKSGGYYKSSNYLFNSAAPSTSQSSLNDTSNFSIGANPPAGLQSGHASSIDPHHVSDIDSDSNTVGTSSSFRKLQTRSTNASSTTEPESPPSLEGFSKKANSLFINSDTNNSTGLINISSNNSSRSNSSITSLTTKFENQGIRSPTLYPEDPSLVADGRQILSRRASSHRSGLSSKSSTKSSSGHVHKRSHPPRNDSFKNAADLLGKRRSSSSHESFPQFTNNHPAQYEKIHEVVSSYDKLRYDNFDGSSLEDFGSISYSELPSQAFKLTANSPTSLFENPINNASLFNAAMPATVEPNHINTVPNPTEMLEEDGFHFLNSSPYNIA